MIGDVVELDEYEYDDYWDVEGDLVDLDVGNGVFVRQFSLGVVDCE